MVYSGPDPANPGPRSIASLERLRIGGVDQAVLLRGRDRTNPVILFLHGGPGMPAMFLAHACQRELERRFVVVHWDRRGAGKSYRSGRDSPLTFEQLLSDTFELTEQLRERFHQDRILLVAHSWGTRLGMAAVARRPELYRGYVGVGQLGRTAEIPRIQDEFIRRRATAAADARAIEELDRHGERVRERLLFRFGGELANSTSMGPLLRAGFGAPEYSLRDVMNVPKGVSLYARNFRASGYGVDPLGEVDRVQVPVFFFTGRHDFTDPFELTEEYFRRLGAPAKRLVWFEHSAHFPFFEEPAAFARAMEDVALATSPSSGRDGALG